MTRIRGFLSRVNPLFLRKIGIAWICGFAFSFASFLAGVGPTGAYALTHAAWVSAISGAVVAGFRAVLVVVPGLNLVASDSQPLLNPPKPEAGA